MQLQVIFPERLRKLRSNLNMTQTEFAKKVGFTQAMLSSYEIGNVLPSLDTVYSIAKECSVSIDWLCGIESDEAKLKTYGDAMRYLVNFSRKVQTSISKNNDDSLKLDNGNRSIAEFSLVFHSSIMDHFISEWDNMINLFEENRIDKELYDLWVEKTAKKYDDIPLKQGWNYNDGELCPF